MEGTRRAKIFNAFDALKGFNEEVASKEVRYYNKRELSDEDQEELGRRLGILSSLTVNSKAARANNAVVSVTYYVPCQDKKNEAFGKLGQFFTRTGRCCKVGQKALVIDDEAIPLSDIISIDEPELFEQGDTA